MAITINGSTGISGVDGSVGTPAIIGSDADTGLVFAAGQVTASLNGTAANVALVSGTAQNSTSGTSIDFTGIPSWVKRVTVMFNGVSTSAANFKLVQIGSGTVTTSGYVSQAGALASGGGSGASQRTDGFHMYSNAASQAIYGTMVLILQTGNTWVSSHSGGFSSTISGMGGGSIALSGTLDRVRITSVGSTDTFTAGSINILYE
jgi:hypothetical protein